VFREKFEVLKINGCVVIDMTKST